MNAVIIPYRTNHAQTLQALYDVQSQTVPTTPLLVCNGGEPIGGSKSYLHWTYTPQLALAAVWNRALDFVWQAGGQHALVINNDVRLHQDTYRALLRVQEKTDALFVSAVNVGESWKNINQDEPLWVTQSLIETKGGPDFSCFLITKACHLKYRFDERFYPAYCEDLDYHRRLLLDNDGTKIFSVCIPYLHLASGTLKALESVERQRLETAIDQGSRRHYVQKWGGPVNAERFSVPFLAGSDQDGITTPDLQREILGWPKSKT